MFNESSKDKLQIIKQGVNDLVFISKHNESISPSLKSEIDYLKLEVVDAINNNSSATLYSAHYLGERLDSLQNELSNSLEYAADTISGGLDRHGESMENSADTVSDSLDRHGTSIEKSAELIYKGNSELGKSIEKAGNDIEDGEIVGAVLKSVGFTVGALILGALIGNGISSLSNVIDEKNKEEKKDIKKDAFISQIKYLQERKQYLTFNYIINYSTSKKTGIFSEKQEARCYLINLLEDGKLVKYKKGKISAIKFLND